MDLFGFYLLILFVGGVNGKKRINNKKGEERSTIKKEKICFFFRASIIERKIKRIIQKENDKPAPEISYIIAKVL